MSDTPADIDVRLCDYSTTYDGMLALLLAQRRQRIRLLTHSDRT